MKQATIQTPVFIAFLCGVMLFAPSFIYGQESGRTNPDENADLQYSTGDYGQGFIAVPKKQYRTSDSASSTRAEVMDNSMRRLWAPMSSYVDMPFTGSPLTSWLDGIFGRNGDPGQLRMGTTSTQRVREPARMEESSALNLIRRLTIEPATTPDDDTWGERERVFCTQDALQCPDGSWVGRTGPNCSFVCATEPSDTRDDIDTADTNGDDETTYPGIERPGNTNGGYTNYPGVERPVNSGIFTNYPNSEHPFFDATPRGGSGSTFGAVGGRIGSFFRDLFSPFLGGR